MSSSLCEADITYSWLSRWSISSDKLGSCVSLGCGLGSCNSSLVSKGIIIGNMV